jgi:uncharacterized RDD family membrane protein YckC
VDDAKCAQCGNPTSPGARFCESCGAPLVHEGTPTPRAVGPQQPAYGATRYAPEPGYPGYRVPSAATPYEGVAIRFVAILLDTIIIGIISNILTAPFFAFSLARLATRAILFGPSVGLRILIILVIYFLYFTLLEGHYGQTVGKMAVKIKVVKEADASPIDYGEAAVRTILRVIDGLFVYLVGAILIWSSDEKQRLGDRVAHTVVVKV